MGLDTLDEFSPRDTDPVSLGDDAIRATRAATKQTVAVEHYLDGPHKIPSGTTATRPAAGRAGRLYFNTDIKGIEYDNGTAWTGYKERKAAATILWHGGDIPLTGGDMEIPFSDIIDDPGGYANTQYHQIIMPANSMGIVTSFVQLDTAPGGFGALLTIQQWETGTSQWNPVAQAYQSAVQFFNCTSMVDSRWGTQLRCIFAGPTSRKILSTSLGSSPRFGFAMLGRTS